VVRGGGVASLALAAQATLVHALAFHSVVPSFLVVVVWYAIRVDARRAAVYGLIAGLCEDALSAGTGAAWMISTGSSAVIASMALPRILFRFKFRS